MKRITTILAVTFALMWSVAASAHHSVEGTFLLDQNITLQGTITTLTIRNPHSFINIEAKDASGRLTSWMIEWVGAAARDTTTRKILLRELTRPSDGFRWLGTSKDFLPSQP